MDGLEINDVESVDRVGDGVGVVSGVRGLENVAVQDSFASHKVMGRLTSLVGRGSRVT